LDVITDAIGNGNGNTTTQEWERLMLAGSQNIIPAD